VRLLLDTHAFLWWLADDPRLSRRARTLLGIVENELFLSSASAWEIATKHRIRKLPDAASLLADFTSVLVGQHVSPLAITVEHALEAGRFPADHRDPFDRMLAAQSRLESLPLVTDDPAFAQFAADTLW
jgi:PIN domain nuclease of toxin-antitoxin system